MFSSSMSPSKGRPMYRWEMRNNNLIIQSYSLVEQWYNVVILKSLDIILAYYILFAIDVVLVTVPTSKVLVNQQDSVQHLHPSVLTTWPPALKWILGRRGVLVPGVNFPR